MFLFVCVLQKVYMQCCGSTIDVKMCDSCIHMGGEREDVGFPWMCRVDLVQRVMVRRAVLCVVCML